MNVSLSRKHTKLPYSKYFDTAKSILSDCEKHGCRNCPLSYGMACLKSENVNCTCLDLILEWLVKHNEK